MFKPGDIVGRRAFLGVVHRGVVVPEGVIHGQLHRGVVLDTLEVFSEGRPVKLLLRPENPGDVVLRARAQIGREFDVIRYNCEHVVSTSLADGGESTTLSRAAHACVTTLAVLAGLATTAYVALTPLPQRMYFRSLDGSALPDLVDKVTTSIAMVLVTTSSGRQSGSGFLVASDLLLTNEHVIRDGRAIQALLSDRVQRCSLIARSPRLDLALLRVERGGHPLRFASGCRVGDSCWVIGAPRGLALTVTTGVISALRRGDLGIPHCDVDWTQIDAGISPGSSGSPVLSLDGEVLGVVARSADPSINFAIPSWQASKWLKEVT